MHINILDTESTYRRLLAETDPAQRDAIFNDELAQPYAGLMQIFGAGKDPVGVFKQWHMYTPDDIANGSRQRVTSMIDTLAASDTWGRTARALERARQAFEPYADRIPLQNVTYGLLLANLTQASPLPDRGYTGFGGIPGWVMVVVSDPNEYLLPRLEGCSVHELFHNVHFSVAPMNIMTVPLGQYLVAEGLAESFAASLYGEHGVWFYVTEFDDAQVEQAKRVIGGALDVTGFDAVRGYIFGDVIARHMGLPVAGVPDYSGYAIGYRVVQQYLKRAGKTPVEAMFVPWQDVIAESGYFA